MPLFPEMIPIPIVSVPAPPSLEELEMVETLLAMQTVNTETLDVPLDLQEPTTSMVPYNTSNLILDKPFTLCDIVCDLTNAMEKITEHEDASFSDPAHWLKFRDCMDLVTGRINDIFNYANPEDIAKLDTVKISTPPCRVELVRIKPTPTVRLPTLQTSQDLLALNEYFTCSKTKPKPKRMSRRPRTASANIDYAEPEFQSDTDKKLKPKGSRSYPPPVDGPSQSQIASQDSSTIAPDVRLPPVKADNPDNTNDNNVHSMTEGSVAPNPTSDRVTPDPALVKTKPKQKGKGTFATKSFTLKKPKCLRNYRCKLCDAVLSSACLLTIHHQEKHGILYCDVCNHAFNNPTSLVRHKYQHCELRFHCSCGAVFAFASQLQTHSIVH